LFPVPVLTALGHTRLLAPVAISELFLNFLFSWFFVQQFGLLGIIMGTVLADIINGAMLMFILYLRTSIRPNQYMDWKLFGTYGLILLGLVYWSVGFI
jgi:peptidoglycan biosynthesis protein MviN/MurJ (putative lipid II flippase)